jgi:hypothetical protein
MAAVLIVAVGAAVYYSADKIHEKKEKKRTLKAQRGVIQELYPADGAAGLQQMEDLPVYSKENLPIYHQEDQYPALKNGESKSSKESKRAKKAGKQSVGAPHW